jgi:CheY-like chemotaxis protein
MPGLILIVHPDRKTQRSLHRILGATLCQIDAVDSVLQAEKVLAQRTPDLVVMDHQLALGKIGEAFQAKAKAAGATACLLLIDGDSYGDLPQLFAHGALTNLVGNPMPVLAEELTATAFKLLRGDIFGLDKYLAWGVQPRVVELDDAASRSDVVDALARDVREFGLGPRLASLASLVADELLSNALYNAPVDAADTRLRHADERHAPRPLADREQVTLSYACDARYFAIGVNDRFGSLDRTTVLTHLAKCAARTAADKVDFESTGAGMGLGLVYSCCNHLVFNLAPGQCTEVIGLMDVRFKPAELGRTVASFNVFEQRGER